MILPLLFYSKHMGFMATTAHGITFNRINISILLASARINWIDWMLFICLLQTNSYFIPHIYEPPSASTTLLILSHKFHFFNLYSAAAARDVHWSSQIRASTGDRLAFLRFGSSSSYNNCNPNRFWIEFELQFLKVNRILDHQSYIIDQVNLNIDQVRFS